jgi:hypothetical protein
MNKFKLDWGKIGAYIVDGLRSASGPILSGLGMLGLALAAKKLNIPYQVLLDPNYSMRTTKITQFPQAMASGLTFIPNNSMEAAIGAILEGCKTSSEYYRYEAAKKIYDLIAEASEVTDERTRSYAIMALNSIAKTCRSSYYSGEVIDLIAKIGSGDF